MLLESAGTASGREMALGLVDRNRRLLEHASKHPYKMLPQTGSELSAHVFVPLGWSAGDRRAGIVFFHSSKWDHGNITQFAPHAMFLTSRGAVCVLAEYRMGASDGRAPLEAMADARSAIRWLRMNGEALGIDTGKVVASGGACGAHAAVAAAVCGAEFDDDGDLLDISCSPDALVLFSPVLDVSRKGFGLAHFPDAATAKRANPIKCIRPGLPPMLLFHGSADATAPVNGSRKFAKRMQGKKNACELMEFGGEGHSFFNMNVNDRLYHATVDATDAFLVSLGFLQAGSGE